MIRGIGCTSSRISPQLLVRIITQVDKDSKDWSDIND